MSGLLRRIRRPGAAEETRTEPTALPAPAHGSAPEAPATSADGQRLPAGVAPEDVERRALSGRRRALRRRARFLRRARELALRDLGGVVYEARRRQQDGGKVVEDKLQRLTAIDAELHGLDDALGTPRGETVIREPGIGGTCARCGELHGSVARFCAQCGANLEEAAREAAEAERKAAAAKAAETHAQRKARAGSAAAEEAERQAATPEAGPPGTEAEDAARGGNGVPPGTEAEDAARGGNGVPVTPATRAEQPSATRAQEQAETPAREPEAAPDEPAREPLAARATARERRS